MRRGEYVTMKTVFSPMKATMMSVALAAGIITVAGATTIGPHAARCESGQPSVIANVSGFRARTGTLRVQLYAANARTYLERRQYLQRIDLPVTASGDMAVCVPVPAAGRYVISIRHDQNGNGSSDRSDGGGFSGNPRVSALDMVFRRKPPLERVSFAVAVAPVRVNVTVNYLNGTRFEPVAPR
jgi:uncharacterized protein (DUF2141 family)